MNAEKQEEVEDLITATQRNLVDRSLTAFNDMTSLVRACSHRSSAHNVCQLEMSSCNS